MIDTDSGWKRLDDVLAPLPAEDRDAILHAFDYLEETAAFAARAVETARLLR